MVLVLVSQSKLLWECLLDHIIGHFLTNTLGKEKVIILTSGPKMKRNVSAQREFNT